MTEPMNENAVRQAAVRRVMAAGFACLLVAQAGAALAQQAAPEILRGSSAPPLPPRPATSEPANDSADVVAAGNRVWFVDKDEGTLVGCRLINTSYVGAERIECSARDLPEASR
ncbi:MAG: hypothetical protein R3D28_26645 [Geminicoccaceae bacterium]|jgi:hypothetical protein|nr:hypothetical protein [Geminicoccaceae bacterium]